MTAYPDSWRYDPVKGWIKPAPAEQTKHAAPAKTKRQRKPKASGKPVPE